MAGSNYATTAPTTWRRTLRSDHTAVHVEGRVDRLKLALLGVRDGYKGIVCAELFVIDLGKRTSPRTHLVTISQRLYGCHVIWQSVTLSSLDVCDDGFGW